MKKNYRQFYELLSTTQLENRIVRLQKELDRQKKQHQEELLLVLLGFIIIELLTIFIMGGK